MNSWADPFDSQRNLNHQCRWPKKSSRCVIEFQPNAPRCNSGMFSHRQVFLGSTDGRIYTKKTFNKPLDLISQLLQFREPQMEDANPEIKKRWEPSFLTVQYHTKVWSTSHTTVYFQNLSKPRLHQNLCANSPSQWNPSEASSRPQPHQQRSFPDLMQNL